MKNELGIKRTSLSTTTDVQATLEWKLSTIDQDAAKMEVLADYMARSIDEVESSLKQLTAVKKEISEREKVLKSQKQFILEECAKFILGYGSDRFEGNLVSSVTVSKGKPILIKPKFKTNLSKKEQEHLICDAGMGYYSDEEVPATPDTIRINRRKIAHSEVIEDEKLDKN